MSNQIPLDHIWKFLYTNYDVSREDGETKEEINKTEVVEILLKQENVPVEEKTIIFTRVLLERCLSFLFPYHSVLSSCKDKYKATYPLVKLSEEKGHAREMSIPIFPDDKKKQILDEVKKELMLRRSSSSLKRSGSFSSNSPAEINLNNSPKKMEIESQPMNLNKSPKKRPMEMVDPQLQPPSKKKKIKK